MQDTFIFQNKLKYYDASQAFDKYLFFNTVIVLNLSQYPGTHSSFDSSTYPHIVLASKSTRSDRWRKELPSRFSCIPLQSIRGGTCWHHRSQCCRHPFSLDNLSVVFVVNVDKLSQMSRFCNMHIYPNVNACSSTIVIVDEWPTLPGW